MNTPDEDDLRARFQRQREADGRTVPPFQALASPPRPRRVRPWLAIPAVAVVAMLLLTVPLRRQEAPPARAPSPAGALDPLLHGPAHAALSTLPSLGLETSLSASWSKP
jgi:hypothetical protein